MSVEPKENTQKTSTKKEDNKNLLNEEKNDEKKDEKNEEEKEEKKDEKKEEKKEDNVTIENNKENEKTNKKENKSCIFLIFFTISNLLFIIILIILSSKYNKDDKNFDIVYICSKFMTIKFILKNNHNSKIIYDFSTDGDPNGLEITYKNLLKLSKENGCTGNYKKCGILDTYGNTLCIDENFECPINQMKIDLFSKTNEYLNKDFKYVPLKKLTYNYRFFYSNNFPDEKPSVIIIKSEEVEPKFISLSNFILDYETFKHIYGNVLENVISIFDSDGNNGNNDKDDDDDDDTIDSIFNIINMVSESSSIYLEFAKLGAKGLLALSKIQYNKKLEKFKNYVNKKIEEDEENIDIYFNHIGDDFYVKNYIGFKSVKDLNTFMDYDYSFAKNIFPNKAIFIITLVYCILLLVISVIIIVFCYKTLSEKESSICLYISQSILYFLVLLYVLIYSISKYIQIKNNDKKLDKLKDIKSDKFINNFIDEFVSICEHNKLILTSIIMCVISLLLNIIEKFIFFYFKIYE